MPFSQRRLDEIEQGIRHALVSLSINDWERRFLRDMQAKLDRFGRQTRLTDKQYRRLMQLVAPHSSDERSAKPKPFYRVRRRGGRRRRLRAWDFVVLAAISLAVAFVGSERFPEFFGPVVKLSAVETIEGRVSRTRDGDTIVVAGTPVRFGSLDCAERGTSAGRRATGRMMDLVNGEVLTCHLNGRTSYDRKIGSCRLWDGRDLAAIMIREGYCRRYW